MVATFQLFSLLTCACLYSSAQQNDDQSDQTLRLPVNLFPLQYELKMFVEPGPEVFTFRGTVTIQVICGEETNTMLVNFCSLKIPTDDIVVEKFELNDERTKLTVNKSKTKADDKSQILTITVDEKFEKMRTYDVIINFDGILDTTLTGFYRSSYFDSKSQAIRWLAVTQADPTFARCIFPSMDQPDMKSKFIISIGHDKKFNALTNSQLDKSEPYKERDGWVLDQFKLTEQISTYSVTMIVSEFVNSSNGIKLPPGNIPVGFWSRPDVQDQLKFASDIVVDALTFFGELFKLPFTFQKFDIAVIPDFQFINKEGFALATFRESDVLIHPEWSSDDDQVNTALIVSHYMAKQWIGALLTMEWFDNTWMKEGFCNYFAIIYNNQKFPRWNSSKIDFIAAFIDSLALDGLQAAHPLLFPIKSLTQVELLYDRISFRKGSLIARLLSIIVGERVFNDSFIIYVSTYIYKTAQLDDFWKIFTQTIGEGSKLPEGVDVKAIMDKWVSQPYYPILTVTKDGSGVTVSQEAFIFNPKSDATDTKKICWWIPLIYTTSSELNFENPRMQWLKCDEKVKLDVQLGPNDYLLLNLNLTALCRVDYGEEMWKLISQTLMDEKKFTNIDVFSRVQLLSDMYGLAWIERFSYTFMFETFGFLKHETEFAVWQNAWSILGYLRKMLAGTNLEGAYQAFTRSLIEPMFKKLGAINDFPNDDPLQSRFKSFFISKTCAFAIDGCQTAAEELFKKWLDYNRGENQNAENPIHRNIRGIVFCQGIVFGGQTEWDLLFAKYEKTVVASEKMILQQALTCSQDEKILRQYLEYSIDSKYVRPQDSAFIFKDMANSDASYLVMRQFFFERFQEIYEFHKGNQVTMGQYLLALYSRIMTTEALQEMEDFIKTVSDQLSGADLRLNEARSIADDNISWRSRNFDAVAQALQGYVNS